MKKQLTANVSPVSLNEAKNKNVSRAKNILSVQYFC